ncbi:hypothetical protein EBT25_18165, partial [bacterium]|nr:hypothetical protein [bacterium]
MSLRITDGIFEKTYDKKLILIDSDNRNVITDTTTSEFTIQLSESLRDVVAITPVQVLFNGSFSATNILLDINGYRHTTVDKYDASSLQHVASVTGFLPLNVATTGVTFNYQQS